MFPTPWGAGLWDALSPQRPQELQHLPGPLSTPTARPTIVQALAEHPASPVAVSADLLPALSLHIPTRTHFSTPLPWLGADWPPCSSQGTEERHRRRRGRQRLEGCGHRPRTPDTEEAGSLPSRSHALTSDVQSPGCEDDLLLGASSCGVSCSGTVDAGSVVLTLRALCVPAPQHQSQVCPALPSSDLHWHRAPPIGAAQEQGHPTQPDHGPSADQWGPSPCLPQISGNISSKPLSPDPFACVLVQDSCSETGMLLA